MMTKCRGFTLIEVIIVLFILAILGLAINALWGDTISTRAYGTARKIQSDLIFAQESAMTHRTHYRVTFLNLPNGYTIQACNSQTSPCPGWSNVIDPSTNNSPFTVTLNSGSYSGVSWATTTFNSNYLEFNSSGTPLDGNTTCGTAPCPFTAVESVTINPGALTVSVTPGTGKTSIP